MTVYVLIAVLAGPSLSTNIVNLGTYATEADCQKVATEARKVQDIRPDRFRCVAVQRVG